MLRKLLKYDLKYMFKFLIIFYSLAIFFGTLTRIFLSIENSLIMEIIGKICSGAAISMMFSILINNLMRMWVRFRSNFYGDESYLTHTLPISKGTLYLYKTLASVISLFVSVAVIGLILYIAYYSKENIELVKNLLLPVADVMGSSVVKIILAFLFICFLEIANMLQSGFSGIILGHKMNNVKVGFSVLYGFGCYIVTQVFVIIIMFIVGLFNKDIMNLFFTNELVNIDMIKFIIYLAIFIYTLTLVIGYIVNVKLFNKGVNVD